ncbi:Retrovirus-related Pol polyprotein from transposon opus, partial [Smittium culicis]
SNTVRKQRKPPDKPQSKNDNKYDIKNDNEYDIKNDNEYDIKNDNEYDSENDNEYDSENDYDYEIKNEHDDNDDNNNYDINDDFTTFATNISSLHFTDDIVPPTALTTMNLHLNENICFKIIASINDFPVSVLLDSGSQITSISSSIVEKLNLKPQLHKPIKIKLGNNSSVSTSDKVVLTFLAASAIDCLPTADPDISEILRSVAQLFDPTPSIIKTDFPHRLRLTTDQPVHSRMRRYSPEETRTLREHVQELYKAGYARPSTSPYSANPLIVPKADGTPRVVINFRPLNKVTIRDEYPLPRIDIILNQLFGCRFYSKLDVLKAFYQIPLHADSVEASAFSTPDGHHEFLVMPQGMSNSPATFQRNIDRTLRQCIGSGYCAAFADDILVFSKTRKEHLVHLRSVLSKLKEKGFKLNPKKCIFAVPKVDILGYTVSENGQEIAEEIVSAVKKFTRPTNVPALRRFLGMVLRLDNRRRQFKPIRETDSDLLM